MDHTFTCSDNTAPLATVSFHSRSPTWCNCLFGYGQTSDLNRENYHSDAACDVAQHSMHVRGTWRSGYKMSFDSCSPCTSHPLARAEHCVYCKGQALTNWIFSSCLTLGQWISCSRRYLLKEPQCLAGKGPVYSGFMTDDVQSRVITESLNVSL